MFDQRSCRVALYAQLALIICSEIPPRHMPPIILQCCRCTARNDNCRKVAGSSGTNATPVEHMNANCVFEQAYKNFVPIDSDYYRHIFEY